MNGSLVDTNVIISFLKGDGEALRLFDSANGIAVPVIVVGELFYGANKSVKVRENLKKFNDFLSEYTIVPVNIEVAEAFGKIKSQLAKSGKPIPENDIWIAAIAKANSMPLITFDSHFLWIEGLEVVNK